MASVNPPERLADEAKLLRETAKLLPPGAVRDATVRAARQATIALYADIVVHLDYS